MIISFHNHSLYSDGKNSIEEIVLMAEKLKVDALGISDHFCLTKKDKFYRWAMLRKHLDAYIQEILAFKDHINPKVYLGLEADYVEGMEGDLAKIVNSKPFDFLIGSVHLVDDVDIADKVEFNAIKYTNDQKEIGIKKYWDSVRKMAESKVFNIVGHIDLYKKFGLYPDEDISKEIDLALQAILKANMAIEVNTSGYFAGCKEQYPSEAILKKIKEYNIPIIVNADSHDAEHLCRGYETVYPLLKKLGFSKQVYFIKRKMVVTDL
ncbi:MAG: histidinol-phosphatase [Chlamydiae bacterium]|nr:histidinol-phosphatase [Chlamydiota bacterium]